VFDCDIVMASSAKYREEQDYLAEFVKDRIVEHPSKSLRLSDVKTEFKNWYGSNYDKKTIPKMKEIENYMDKRFGKCKGNPKEWKGIGYNISEAEDDPSMLFM
jgi:hypothetical protein